MAKNDYKFKELDDIQWLLLRPHNIIGTMQNIKQTGFVLKDGKFVYEDYTIVPAFFKIINEIIDNSIDAYIKSNFTCGNKIDITMTDDTITVKDNGPGIPIEKHGDSYIPVTAWGKPRAGTNFDDSKNVGSLGMNGVGSFATVVFSKLFIGETADGKHKFKVEFKNNLSETIFSKPTKSTKRGTTVTFKPDLERFGLTKIDKIYKDLVYQRLINIAFSYKDLQFTFNKKAIKVNSKTYISQFGDNATMFEGENYVVAFLPNPDDDFRFFAYTNGLANTKQGSQIDYFLERVVNTKLKDKLQKKYKSIKAGDIKNKLTMIVFFRGFKTPKFDGQAKEQFTSPASKISEFLGKIDFDKWVDKIYQNKSIVEPIIEVYRIKEEFEKRKALKGLEKPKKRIDTKKYTPAIGRRKYLLVAEGESASGGLMPALGRENFGYFELKGKPLNAYDATQSKFQQNAELSLLYNIIKTEGYEMVIYATDQDLDGYTIRGLLNGFFYKYLRSDWLLNGKVGSLKTPIRGKIKNGKIIDWVYNLSDGEKLSNQGQSKYFKGIGSWKPEWLQTVIKKDGIEKMIDMWEFDEAADETIDSWLNGKRVDIRKEYLRNNDFDLIKL